ncbi:hypothetical protein H6G80_04620 [Nostoc sp. FACHB-87]|uniref:hypothetical protein n=1 Tax=Nostocales TaxID=1161 RepID=UPI001683D3EC|nr:MULTISPECIES: hypothetical protein [Nostocales]MBD2453356.1 hypothetical protein [Nostoc sp. FACHB-87]MBD2475480.1 hypothetical protein [Anabaena sp. FACHB-83]MBD2490252.1 hypothetical protein [Aulosira sp. FACHB-615]
MIAYIVCEGASDVELLQRVLPKELLNNIEIVAAGGLSAIKSLARSLVVRRQVPIAIVADADSVAPEVVQERLSSIEEIVKSVAIDTQVKVILAVPSIEIIFFQDRSLLSRLLGYEPSPEMLSLATSQPNKVLKQLLSQSQRDYSQSSITQQLTNDDLKILRQNSVIQEVIHFLQSVQQTATVL